MDDKVILLFKSLSDKSRLRIVNCLFKGPMYVELLAETLDLAPSTISFHLKKLEDAGLISSKKDQYYVVYSLKEEMLNLNLKDLLTLSDYQKDMIDAKEQDYKNKVIESFFKYGKLMSIPVQRKKKRIVLEKISEAFEENKQYTEREVNIIIADFNDDFCTLRRGLVEEKLLKREGGIYKKL